MEFSDRSKPSLIRVKVFPPGLSRREAEISNRIEPEHVAPLLTARVFWLFLLKISIVHSGATFLQFKSAGVIQLERFVVEEFFFGASEGAKYFRLICK